MEAAVASVCDICGKGPGFSNNVSHSHVRTRRRWNPNIQTVRAIVSGTPKRLNVCTSCINAGKVTRSATVRGDPGAQEAHRGRLALSTAGYGYRVDRGFAPPRAARRSLA